MQRLCDFFQLKPGITALIGGGGKTSTMYALAEELRTRGSVIICTSTHILCPPQYPHLNCFDQRVPFGKIYATGEADGRKLAAPMQSFSELCKFADYILVEADGSRQLPLKAHAAHEPVIPSEANSVLVVIGIDGLGKPIADVAHRPQLYASVCDSVPEAVVTEQMIHKVVSRYPRCDGIVINKADDDYLMQKSISLAKLFTVPVAVTAWQTEHPIKWYWRPI